MSPARGGGRLTPVPLLLQREESTAGLPRPAVPFGNVGMSGRWSFRLDVAPPRGRAFRVSLADRMLG